MRCLKPVRISNALNFGWLANTWYYVSNTSTHNCSVPVALYLLTKDLMPIEGGSHNYSQCFWLKQELRNTITANSLDDLFSCSLIPSPPSSMTSSLKTLPNVVFFRSTQDEVDLMVLKMTSRYAKEYSIGKRWAIRFPNEIHILPWIRKQSLLTFLWTGVYYT